MPSPTDLKSVARCNITVDFACQACGGSGMQPDGGTSCFACGNKGPRRGRGDMRVVDIPELLTLLERAAQERSDGLARRAEHQRIQEGIQP